VSRRVQPIEVLVRRRGRSELRALRQNKPLRNIGSECGRSFYVRKEWNRPISMVSSAGGPDRSCRDCVTIQGSLLYVVSRDLFVRSAEARGLYN
jgi:hypothetical protein